jgi:hypothetical protein
MQNIENRKAGQEWKKKHRATCLECIKSYVLKSGISRESIVKGKLENIILSFSKAEILSAGYILVDSYYIDIPEKINRVYQKAIELLASGNRIQIIKESLVIGISGIFISLYAKNVRITTVPKVPTLGK